MEFSNEDKLSVRNAILQWSSIAGIAFIEKAGSEATDVTIVSAFIPTGDTEGGSTCGLGYPAFEGQPCNQLAGLLIINPKCDQTLPIALHEIGHVLGLGHVASENVMNPDRLSVFSTLQSGDILGAQSIYGTK